MLRDQSLRENWIALPETNIAPKMVVSNRNLLFQGSIFRGELLVSGRVLGNSKSISRMNVSRAFQKSDRAVFFWESPKQMGPVTLVTFFLNILDDVRTLSA